MNAKIAVSAALGLLVLACGVAARANPGTSPAPSSKSNYQAIGGSANNSAEATNGNVGKEKEEMESKEGQSSSGHGGGGGGGSSGGNFSGGGKQGMSSSSMGNMFGGSHAAQFQKPSQHQNNNSKDSTGEVSAREEKSGGQPTDPRSVAEAIMSMLDSSTSKPEPPPACVTELSDAATAGKPASQCWYAVWLLNQPGTKDNYSTALDLLQHSATGGYAPAKAALQIIDYYAARGDYSDPEQTGQNEIEHSGDAAVLYYTGRALLAGPDHCAAAFKIMKLASSLGSQAATAQLSIMYQNGLGTERDPGKAFLYANEAVKMKPCQPNAGDEASVGDFKKTDADNAARFAREQLALCYATGIGTPVDLKLAATYINKSPAEKLPGSE
jgi:TPR repeat protein